MNDARTFGRWLMCVAAAVGLAGSVAAQDVPFTGIVEQDNVEVRAGAGRTFYVVGTLRRGQKVQVDKIIFGWHQIEAPDGTYSYVSKAFVDAKGDGKSGVVNADRTAIKAAATTGPGDSYRRQIDLMRGDTVEIVGEEGGFYKIRPPAAAFVYVAPGAIRRATAEELQPPITTTTTTTTTPDRPVTTATNPDTAIRTDPNTTSIEQMVTTPPTTTTTPPPPEVAPPDTTGTTATTPPDTTPPDTTATTTTQRTAPVASSDKAFAIEPQSERVKQIDAKMKASIDLPLEQQPVDELLAEYRAAQRDPQLPPIDHEIVKFRIATLQRNKALAEGLRQIQAAQSQVATSQATEKSVESFEGPVVYAAVGQLLASSVYDGVTLPRMYRVVAPGGGRTIAYIRPDSVKNASATLGKIVGVAGPMRFDTGLKANVIEAKRIDVLEKTSEPMTPAAPPEAPEAPASPGAQAEAHIAPPPPVADEAIELPDLDEPTPGK